MYDIAWHDISVNKALRSNRNKQKPSVIWFTGLSGSGKSTTANALERTLFDLGNSTYLLDGDNVRFGLCKDLGFSNKDRIENIRRVGEVSKLLVDAGLVVITSFISPFRDDRNMVRSLFDQGEFIEVYVKTSLDVCEARDTKGLYRKARNGEIKDFTGIDSPYEAPLSPEIVIDTEIVKTEEIIGSLIRQLNIFGILAK